MDKKYWRDKIKENFKGLGATEAFVRFKKKNGIDKPVKRIDPPLDDEIEVLPMQENPENYDYCRFEYPIIVVKDNDESVGGLITGKILGSSGDIEWKLD